MGWGKLSAEETLNASMSSGKQSSFACLGTTGKRKMIRQGMTFKEQRCWCRHPFSLLSSLTTSWEEGQVRRSCVVTWLCKLRKGIWRKVSHLYEAPCNRSFLHYPKKAAFTTLSTMRRLSSECPVFISTVGAQLGQ